MTCHILLHMSFACVKTPQQHGSTFLQPTNHYYKWLPFYLQTEQKCWQYNPPYCE